MNKNPKASNADIGPERTIPLEKLISEFSTQFTNASSKEIDGKIEWALMQIAESLDLDRCTFWEFSDDESQARWTHQYTASGYHKFSPAVAPERDFPWFFKKALSGEAVSFCRHAELPQEASVDIASSRSIGEKSVIFIPYKVAGKIICGLSFACMRRERKFPAYLIPKLKLAGEVITSAFHRKKLEEKYETALQKMQHFTEQVNIKEVHLRQETENEFSYQNIIGQSLAMRHCFFRIEQVALTDSTVLILGETGTGKGMIGQAIHSLSPRKSKALVTVNCAALAPNLIESELFGSEKGAFTSSSERRIGRFELADKGTIILDEIAELSLEMQAKLLRVIQDGEFERLGSSKTIKVDVRIIAITNRDLREEVSKGNFRQDLYYRLHVFPIMIPPLRERTDDIPLLVDYFVIKFSRKMRKEIHALPKQSLAAIKSYNWPGNVRELEHVIEQAVIITEGNTLQLADKLGGPNPFIYEGQEITNLSEIERRHILLILDKVGWRIEGPKGAATLLGLHPNTLRYRMSKLGLSFRRVVSPNY